VHFGGANEPPLRPEAEVEDYPAALLLGAPHRSFRQAEARRALAVFLTAGLLVAFELLPVFKLVAVAMLVAVVLRSVTPRAPWPSTGRVWYSPPAANRVYVRPPTSVRRPAGERWPSRRMLATRRPCNI
jgi:hypothetical protein